VALDLDYDISYTDGCYSEQKLGGWKIPSEIGSVSMYSLWYWLFCTLFATVWIEVADSQCQCKHLCNGHIAAWLLLEEKKKNILYTGSSGPPVFW
jgi:hypothetical protein